MPPGVMYPDHFRAQVVFQLKTALAEDRIVNTFNFRNDDPLVQPGDVADTIRTTLDNFYFGVHTSVEPGTHRIGSFLNKDPVASIEYRVYDLGQDEPRAPIIRTPAVAWATMMGGGVGSPPLEVGACISWQSDIIPPKAGVVGKRGRGRTYLGPLGPTAIGQAPSTLLPVVSSAFRSAMTAAARDLLSAPGVQLVILSPTYQQTDVVTKGYVDDAFDTQRRRGQDPSLKALFDTDTPAFS